MSFVSPAVDNFSEASERISGHVSGPSHFVQMSNFPLMEITMRSVWTIRTLDQIFICQMFALVRELYGMVVLASSGIDF
jgi:hypothetical protein